MASNTDLFVLDEREVWWRAILEAGSRAGYHGERITRGRQVQLRPGVGFIRPHADPRRLISNRTDFVEMNQSLQMVQDGDQVWVYENKSEQFFRWGRFMPDTWSIDTEAAALEFLRTADYPIVSKADQGASSTNVRILANRRDAERHVREIFRRGILVNCCSGGAKVRQTDYVLLQRFIPHEVTWRVNAIGAGRAIFRRFCYRDRPVAQTGNVEPVMRLDDTTKSLLRFADQVFAEIGTRWCALDILRDGNQWRLLETSLAWPWPSPGDCNAAPIFRTDHAWLGMFDAMFDQIRAGQWN